MLNKQKTVFIFCATLIACTASADQFDEALQLKNSGKLADAEMAFTQLVQQSPNDKKALEQLAIVQSWQNKFDASISVWRRLLALDASNVDARTGLARVLYWNGERAESLRLLKGVVNDQPSDAAAWTLLGDVQMADGKIADARQSYLQAKRLSPKADANLDKKIAQAVAPTQWRVDLGFVADHYSKERGSENSSYLQLGYTTLSKTTVYAKFERFNYFDKNDESLAAGVYWLPAPSLLINAEAAKSGSDPFFRPESLYGLSVDWLLSDSIQPLLSYRHSNYDNASNSGAVKTTTPGVRILFDNMNIELKYAKTENLDDSSTHVSSVKWNWEGESLRPYVAYTTGEEATPPLAVAKINVISGGVVWSINRSWGMRFDLAHEDRKDTYKHDSFGVGLSHYF